MKSEEPCSMSCKSVLRREMIQKRKELFLKNGDEFVKKIRELGCYKKANTVMLYMPIKGEADVTGLLCDKKLFLTPVTEGENIYACPISGAWRNGLFSVPEPKEKTVFDKTKIDLVIVPGVAFDKRGNRMGYGKGYYDRFLNGLDICKVGVCHSFQLMDTIPSEDHDIKMDIIVTEREVWSRENIL